MVLAVEDLPFHYTLLGALLCLGILLTLSFPAKANDVFSYLINKWLCWRYPIKSVDGKKAIPTCAYRWPNGTGDVGKFLSGIENSDKWDKDFGGRVYRIWSGTKSEVVITQPEDVQTVFKDSDQHSKALNNNSGWLMGELLGQCVGLISGRSWRTTRAVTETHFLQSQSRNYIELIERHVDRHLSALLQSPDSPRKGLLNPVKDLRLLPFRIVAEILYGELSVELREELEAMIPLRESIFMRMIQGGWARFWWSQYLPFQINRDLREFQKRWSAFNDKAYARTREKYPSAAVVQIFDAVLSSPSSSSSSPIAENRTTTTRAQAEQTLDEMLFANLDVTMGGLSWNLVFLAANPAIQAQLRREIKENSHHRDDGSDTEAQSTRWRTYLLSSSSLLSASILESARLRPLAAFTVPQSAPTARVVDSYLVPAGTNFVVDTYALNVRNRFWGEEDDARAYRPQRFFEKGRGSMERRYQYWRFGFGPRSCLGRYVVDLFIRVLLCRVLEGWELEVLEREGEERVLGTRDQGSWITHPVGDLRCEKLKEEKSGGEGGEE